MKIVFFLLMSLSLWAGIGNIMAMKGSAQVLRSSGNVSAKMGLELLEHDRITTSKKSRVQVMLSDSTVVTIGANSSFSFDTFSYDGTKNSQVAMSAQRGFFRSVTGKIGKMAPERFKVKTVSATIGIRGTDFSADIRAGRELIKCYSGVITVKYNSEESVVVAGMQLELRKENTKVKDVQPQKKSDTSPQKTQESTSSIDKKEVPTEVVSDITQIANDQPPADALEITPATEDRPAEY